MFKVGQVVKCIKDYRSWNGIVRQGCVLKVKEIHPEKHYNNMYFRANDVSMWLPKEYFKLIRDDQDRICYSPKNKPRETT